MSYLKRACDREVVHGFQVLLAHIDEWSALGLIDSSKQGKKDCIHNTCASFSLDGCDKELAKAFFEAKRIYMAKSLYVENEEEKKLQIVILRL